MNLKSIVITVVALVSLLGCEKSKEDASKQIPRGMLEISESEAKEVHVDSLEKGDRSVIADVNGDGLKDVVSASSGAAPKVVAIIQGSNDSYEKKHKPISLRYTNDVMAVYSLHLNEDVYEDVVVLQDGGFITLLTSNEEGELKRYKEIEPDIRTNLFVHSTPMRVENGKKVFYWAYEESLNNGTMIFKYTQEKDHSDEISKKVIKVPFDEITAAAGGKPLKGIDEIRAGNLNGDDLLDLAILDMAANRVYTLIAESEDSFVPTEIISDPLKPYNFELLKINDDDLDDLYISHTFPKRKPAHFSFLYFNGGQGKFIESSRQMILTSVQCLSAEVAQIDQEGPRRLVVASNYNGGLFTYKIHPDGTVDQIPDVQYRPKGYPVVIGIADMNNDGVNDMVTANESKESGTISIFLSKSRQLLEK